jgi:hypothetical protein
VGERQLGALLLGVERVDRALDQEVRPGLVAQQLADQDAADLARRIGLAPRDSAVERLLRQEHAERLLGRRAGLAPEIFRVDRSNIE